MGSRGDREGQKTRLAVGLVALFKNKNTKCGKGQESYCLCPLAARIDGVGNVATHSIVALQRNCRMTRP